MSIRALVRVLVVASPFALLAPSAFAQNNPPVASEDKSYTRWVAELKTYPDGSYCGVVNQHLTPVNGQLEQNDYMLVFRVGERDKGKISGHDKGVYIFTENYLRDGHVLAVGYDPKEVSEIFVSFSGKVFIGTPKEGRLGALHKISATSFYAEVARGLAFVAEEHCKQLKNSHRKSASQLIENGTRKSAKDPSKLSTTYNPSAG